MAGSIRQLKNGKYEITFSITNEEGLRTRHYERIEAKSMADAERQSNLLYAELMKNEGQKESSITFGEYYKKWFALKSNKGLAPKTLFRYDENARLYLIPRFGNVKLSKIKPLAIELFYNELRTPQKRIKPLKNGKKSEKTYSLSEQTILHIHTLLSQIMTSAFDKELILKNPILKVERPVVRNDDKPDCYSPDEMKKMFDLLQSEDLQFQVAIYIAALGGLRLGEIAGLSFTNVNYEENTIDINKSGQYLPKHGIFTKQPKNKKSNRKISVPAELIDMIKLLEKQYMERRLTLANKWQGGYFKHEKPTKERPQPCRILIQGNGLPIFPETPSKQWKTFIKKHGLRDVNFHSLRHFSISYLLSKGSDVVSVAKRHGHVNPNVTLTKYSHVFSQGDIKNTDIMTKLIEKEDTLKDKKQYES